MTTGPDGVQPEPRFERRATLRLGQRELSRITMAFGALILAGVLFGMYHVYLNFKSQRDIVIAKENLLALYKGMRHYADDWDDHLPAASKWTDDVAGYLSAPSDTPGGALAALHGPADDGTVSYAYNIQASRYNLAPVGTAENRNYVDPATLPLLVERLNAPRNAVVDIPPQVSAQAQAAFLKQLQFVHYASDPTHASTVVLFASGSIVVYTRKDLEQSGAGGE